MFNLLTSPSTRRNIRGLIGVVSDAVRSVVAPSTLVEQLAAETSTVVTTVEVPEPAGLFTEDELPELADIERAALGYDLAADSARSADRAKRKHRKILDGLPSGTYGGWLIRRIASNKQTPDLVAIRATYERLGLGDVPMRTVAPSLRVERVPADVDTATLAAA